ncbi:MAG: hypothetical protein LBQ77_02960 [Treponema sp.]|jgi:hypothetical protein|nr:hypothetical protein [Treponema sp.]
MIDRFVLHTIIKIYTTPKLRTAARRLTRTVFSRFFGAQYKAQLFPKRIPVFSVDHQLDDYIPFVPQYVSTYLNFMAFWIRPLGILLKKYPSYAREYGSDLIHSVERLYLYASDMYQHAFSTTSRPRYLKSWSFILIHATDPHLCCVPSLHVMLALHTYIKIGRLFRSLNIEHAFGTTLRTEAIHITEAVLHVKQHSVNCIAAALYTMHCFDPLLFNHAEINGFIDDLFAEDAYILPKNKQIIQDHIHRLYKAFCDSGATSSSWKQPLLNFLFTQPRVR